MKKIKIKNPRVLAFFATGMALLVAIITSSIAWFMSSSSSVVRSQALTISALDTASLNLIVPDLAAEYERYMGETGTEYDGQDSPYLVEYMPVNIGYSEDENTVGCYLVYYFDADTSYIQPVIAGSDPVPMSADSLWDNFVMNLVKLEIALDGEDQPILDENGDNTYVETGDVYYGENGFFRHTVTNELLQPEEGDNYFALKIYFQGDVGYHLLQSTHADIDAAYTFDYCHPDYMFATFHINAVFNMVRLNNLTFAVRPYSTSYSELTDYYMEIDDEDARTITFTGFSLVDVDGSARAYPLPEIYDRSESNVCLAYYFADWAYFEENAETGDVDHYRYRLIKANDTPDDVVTLALHPLRGRTEQMCSTWGDSYEITLDFNDGETDPATYYARPQSNYYAQAASIVYSTGNKGLRLDNPTGDTTLYPTGVCSQNIAAPNRDGYRFLGWSASRLSDYAVGVDTAAAPYLFTAGNSYTYDFGTSGNGHDCTLYAVWQELGVNVTFVVDSNWTHNYATVVGDHITIGGVDYPLVNNTVTVELPKHTNLAAVTAVATATITSTSTPRNLTIKTWNYLNSSGVYTGVSGYDLVGDLTVYAVWNERAEYIVTLDVNMYSSAVLYNYGTIAVSSPINVDHYTIGFNDNGGSTYSYSGTYSDENRQDIKVKVLEGMTLADLGLSVAWNRHGTGMGSNSFEGWYSNVGSKENDMATTSWSTLNYNATKYNTSTAITANIKLWVRFN